MNSPELPQTDSIEELARFWDEHNVTDFEGQLEEVRGKVFEREKVVKVHLPSKEANALKALAQSKGLADGDLVRQWVLERVHAS